MYKGVKSEGEYNRMNIYGNKLEEIPVLCPRKKAIARKKIKDPLCSQIKIKPIGKDKYYGFELDGTNVSCKDILECEINNGGCQQLCQNLQGSYACECKTGYVLDGNKVTCEGNSFVL